MGREVPQTHREHVAQDRQAWTIKELWRAFWKSPDEDRAAEAFREWCREVMATRLSPVMKVARMFKAHLRNILTYFRHRISNGPAEAINSRIQGKRPAKHVYRYCNG